MTNETAFKVDLVLGKINFDHEYLTRTFFFGYLSVIDINSSK